MRTILVQSDVKGLEEFCDILSCDLSDFHVASTIDGVSHFDIEVVIIWRSVPGFLLTLPNLKLILICGSGIEHIIHSPALPHNVPLIRLVDPFLRNHVSNYVAEQITTHVLRSNRHKSFQENLSDSFQEHNFKLPKIGIMGLGLVGSEVAQKLVSMGFDVCAWVKCHKPRLLEEVYVGNSELLDFAKNCEVIVCLLPLTNETKGILNIHLFNSLPNSAFLINVGRGAHLNESDLLTALEIGKLSGACLDVIEGETLPGMHPFSLSPSITVTPHIAGYVGPETQAPYAVNIIKKYYDNREMVGLVDYLSFY